MAIFQSFIKMYVSMTFKYYQILWVICKKIQFNRKLLILYLNDLIVLDHPDNNLLWRLSFAKAEKMLMKHANSSGDSTFKKDAYRFIKLYICNMKDQCPGKIQKFSSYCIKQFIFTEFDNWPNKPTEEVIIQRNILKHLIEGLKERCIPNYFLQNDNVLQFIPTDELDLLCRGMIMEYEKLLGKKRSK